MVNEYLDILKSGSHEWNTWRKEHQNEVAFFSNENLDGQNFDGYHLTFCHFYDVSLKGCGFGFAELTWSSFFNCKLNGSKIYNPKIAPPTFHDGLRGVNTRWTVFANCDLENVDLRGALLEGVHFQNCNFKGANISKSRIYGISSWGNIVDDSTIQDDLIITQYDEDNIEVSNFEVAQFLSLLISNKKLKGIFETLNSKLVLILGRFSSERKPFLDRLMLELKHKRLVPVLFDFEKPRTMDFIEPILSIALLSKFVVADVTDPKIILEELTVIVRNSSTVIIPILEEAQIEPVTLINLRINHRSISETFYYENANDLISNSLSEIIEKGYELFEELNKRKQFSA